jgi:hypothetical protein
MDFKEATDDLCDAISHEELASALGVSVATVRQARLRSDAKAHRSPPEDWKGAVARLAKERLDHYRVLVTRLTNEEESVDAASTHHV